MNLKRINFYINFLFVDKIYIKFIYNYKNRQNLLINLYEINKYKNKGLKLIKSKIFMTKEVI